MEEYAEHEVTGKTYNKNHVFFSHLSVNTLCVVYIIYYTNILFLACMAHGGFATITYLHEHNQTHHILLMLWFGFNVNTREITSL